MTSKLFASLALAGTACLGLSVNATAGLSQPGSLLVFPCYDNTRGTQTMLTVTNTSDDNTPGPSNIALGTVDVEFVYINGSNCLETNRTRRLTPNDTVSVLAFVDNPNAQKGYVYVFAKWNGAAVSFNHLIGDTLAFSSSDSKDFELMAITYKAVPSADRAPTDLDGDHVRDLNGLEYEVSADTLVVPRFLGQGSGAESSLCLINLSGGSQFTAIIDFLIYNDNEEVFSAQHSFRCWDRINLADINGAFNDDFLANSTNQNPNEVNVGNTSLSIPETGWFSIHGNTASSSAASIADPAILAARIEALNGDGGAILPFGSGSNANGDLILHGVGADSTP